MATAYQIAASMAGSREGQSALSDFLRTGGVNIDPATRAWCADFVNATMNKAGQKGTDSSMARSFLQWGQAVSDPQRGDVAVFSRGDPKGPYGHVGFFDSVNPDGSIKVLGGNQSDSVSYGNYPADRLLGYRRAGGKMGGDSMVARDHDPQVAGQTSAPVFGSMSPGGPPQPQNNSIDPNVAQYAFGEEKPGWGDRLKGAGQGFDAAMSEVKPPRIAAMPSPSGDVANGLTKIMQNPSALAQMLLKRRMA